MIFGEKIAFVWSIIFPVFIALLVQKSMLDSLTDPNELIKYFGWFWVFIIISTFLNGVGLQAARLREYGLLKTYTLIAGNKYIFIFGMLLTQIVFCSVSLLLFTFIISSIYNVFSMKLVIVPLIGMLLALPFGLATLSLANLPVQYNNLTTIVNIFIYPLFLVAVSFHSSEFFLLKLFNPYKLIYEMTMTFANGLHILQYNGFHIGIFFVSLFYLAIGVFSLKKLNLLSVLQR